MKQRPQLNNRIRFPNLQVVDETGDNLGEMKTSDALKIAQERNLDLVVVGPNANPPVAKIVDYGKYKYQKEKSRKRQEKKKELEMKNVRIGFKTGQHDLETKVKQIDKFLVKGHQVRIEIKLRGRERRMQDLAKTKLMDFLEQINQPFVVEGQPRKSPFGWNITIHYDKIGKNKQISTKEGEDNLEGKNS